MNDNLTSPLAKLQRVAQFARDDFPTYVQFIDRTYKMSKFHWFLSTKLEDAVRKFEGGESVRICLSVPPRHGKSRLACIEMISWLLGRDPKLNVAMLAYGEYLAVEHTTAIRDRIDHPYYRMAFQNTSIRAGSDTKANFKTTAGGGLKAAGIMGGITGLGYNVVIIDDPIRNAREARSKIVKDGVWSEFASTVNTRMTPVYMIVCIHTRWDESDLIGRIKQHEPEKWDFIDLPALCDDPDTDLLKREYDEPLFPEHYSKQRLIELRDLDGKMFSALYQGKPNQQGGNIVSRLDCTLTTLDKVPTSSHKCRGWDLAVATKSHSDFTVGALCAYDHMSKSLYIIDVWRNKKTWDIVKGEIVRCAKSPNEGGRCAIENVSGFEIAAVEVERALAGYATMTRIHPRGRDKQTRAHAWISLAKAGKLFVVKGSWNSQFFDELEGFPTGVHDDAIDAVSIAFEALHNSSSQSALKWG